MIDNEYTDYRCSCGYRLRVKGDEEWTKTEHKKKGKYVGIGTYLKCDQCLKTWLKYEKRQESLSEHLRKKYDVTE